MIDPAKIDTSHEKITKRSVSIAGHRTSISLENIFWQGLQEIASSRGQPLARLIREIDSSRQTNLSSAIRVFVLNHFKHQDTNRA